MTEPLLSFEALKRAAANGEIDTVLVCMVDMQGRLVGKRFQVEFFIDSGHEAVSYTHLTLPTKA